jgi:hypothetical protein
LLAELAEAVAAGDREELLVVGGQSAGHIEHVEPAGAIVRARVAETRGALAEAARFRSCWPTRPDRAIRGGSPAPVLLT